jgi:hypothetical protein
MGKDGMTGTQTSGFAGIETYVPGTSASGDL